MERLCITMIVSFLIILFPPLGAAADISSALTAQIPLYKPPQPGAPPARVGGGGRGPGALILSPLTPDHVGYTISPNLSIYWYLSKATERPLEFVLTEEQNIKPLLRIQVKGVNKPGIHLLNLSKYQVTLKLDREYKWFVALIVDARQRANDIVAGGAILRTAPSIALLTKLKTVDKHRLPFIYAEEGLWYDAIMAISKLIDRRPNDRALREQRAALLQQVMLPEVAAYDRGIATR